MPIVGRRESSAINRSDTAGRPVSNTPLMMAGPAERQQGITSVSRDRSRLAQGIGKRHSQRPRRINELLSGVVEEHDVRALLFRDSLSAERMEARVVSGGERG